jgi:hypothetical protein
VLLGPGVSISLREAGAIRVGKKGGGLVTFDALEPGKPWGAISTVYGRRMEFFNTVLKNCGSEDPNWVGVLNFERSSPDGEAPAEHLLVDQVRIEKSARHRPLQPDAHAQRAVHVSDGAGAVRVRVNDARRPTLIQGPNRGSSHRDPQRRTAEKAKQFRAPSQ